MNLVAVLEGLLFVSGTEGISLEQAMNVLDIEQSELMKLLTELEKMYDSDLRGIRLDYYGEKIKLTTKKEHKEYYTKLLEEDNSLLSRAALETLAIIAYNQPVTRVKVDEIRGVGCAHIIRKLLSKSLIKELGKSELPGRPYLYGVTDEFLDYFGIGTLEELPQLQHVEEMTIDEARTSDLFKTSYNEIGDKEKDEK